MTYTKPQVEVLNSAFNAIEQISNKLSDVRDGVQAPPGPGPAYDLDE